MLIATGVVGIRIWVKRRVQGGFASDDYFMFFGYLAAMAMSVANCLALNVFHLDRHIWDALADTAPVAQGEKAMWIYALCDQFANIGIKISILLFIHKLIARTGRRYMQWAIWFTIAAVAISNGIYMLISWAECFPLNATWDRMNLEWDVTHSYKCLDEAVITVSAGIFNLVLDFVVATLPVLVVWDLHIARTKKASIIALFGLGYL
jgi:hypothetical protein